MSDELFIKVVSESDFWSYYSKQAELTQITIFEILEEGIRELELNEFEKKNSHKDLRNDEEFQKCLNFDLNILKDISSKNYLKHMTLIQLMRRKIENIACIAYENAKKKSKKSGRPLMLEYISESQSYVSRVREFINYYLV